MIDRAVNEGMWESALFEKFFPDSLIVPIDRFQPGDLIWWYRPDREWWDAFTRGINLPVSIPSLLISIDLVGGLNPYCNVYILTAEGPVKTTVDINKFYRRQTRP